MSTFANRIGIRLLIIKDEKLAKFVSHNILKGVIFGFAVFIFAKIMMVITGMMFPMPPIESSMLLRIIGSIMGHIIFGITVALFVKEQVVEKRTFA